MDSLENPALTFIGFVLAVLLKLNLYGESPEQDHEELRWLIDSVSFPPISSREEYEK